ncbi:hypothetical protein EYF80_068431 [Liparis tanakae]|uniref:Uncharacterized protein n=1 Tax=Liparis tanakae TaxID=230148 RepID=A0A4Z2DYG4_9TELE|nr:hypothetical protein EYF80_068431 [Liparis tanakae]
MVTGQQTTTGGSAVTSFSRDPNLGQKAAELTENDVDKNAEAETASGRRPWRKTTDAVNHAHAERRAAIAEEEVAADLRPRGGGAASVPLLRHAGSIHGKLGKQCK